MGSLFDYENGNFCFQISDDMAMGPEGNMLMRMSDDMAMDMDTGEMHFMSSWDEDDDEDDDW